VSNRIACDVREIAASYLRGAETVRQHLDLAALERVVQRLHLAREAGSTVFVAGNGGSAATSSHLVNDLGKGVRLDGAPPVRALALSDNVSWLTALANDEGYERAFAGQLETLSHPGDVLVVISASGNSANLIEAVRCARAREVTTIGLLGFDGGLLKRLVDDYLWLPTEQGAYGLVEDAHLMVSHIVVECLRFNAGYSVPKERQGVHASQDA
jgi:D-sedoheptulose 7-phosphate isomerase